MKSHDFHIWIERLLPSMVRGYVPEHIWKVLAELSFFVQQLCAKQISLKVVEELEKMAPELVCKLENIFPPGFFLSMQHLILHLPNEVRLGRGHVELLVLSNREIAKDCSPEMWKQRQD
jgi:hypothetical protein